MRPVRDADSKNGRKPRFSSSQTKSGTSFGANTWKPHMPKTTLGTAASRSMTKPTEVPNRLGA